MQSRLRTIAREAQRGFTLIEMTVALGLFGFIGVGFILALQSAHRAQGINQEQVIGQNLVRAQLEYIRDQPYLDSYPVSVTLPFQYAMTIDTAPYCTPEPCNPAPNNLQKTTVRISRGPQPLVAVSDLKMRR